MPFGIDDIAIGLGAVGTLGNLFKIKEFGYHSPEDERQARRAELLQKINESRVRTLTQGIQQIRDTTLMQANNARQAAARRAAAMGRTGDAESFILPAESNVLSTGSQASKDFQFNAGRYFDEAALNAEADFANRPIQPSTSDYLQELGAAGLDYSFGQRQLDILQGKNDAIGRMSNPLGGTNYSQSIVNGDSIPRIDVLQPTAPVINDPLTQTLSRFKQTLSPIDRPGLQNRKMRQPIQPAQPLIWRGLGGTSY